MKSSIYPITISTIRRYVRDAIGKSSNGGMYHNIQRDLPAISFRNNITLLSSHHLVWTSVLQMSMKGVSAAIATVIGTLATFALIRYPFRGSNFLDVFFMSPVIVPQVVVGLSAGRRERRNIKGFQTNHQCEREERRAARSGASEEMSTT